MRLDILEWSRAHARRNGVWAAALCAGLLAAWAMHAQVTQRLAQIDADARVPMVSRVVAAFDLDAATVLDDLHVAVRDIPAAYAGSDTLTPEDFAQLTLPLLAVPLKQGDAISAVHLKPRTALPLASRILTGRRAVTIPVDDLSSLSGLLKSGDFIDLYVSFDHAGRQVTAPLLQGVRVLAIGQDEDGAPRSTSTAHGAFSTVTLDVSPEDALKLVAARRSGTMSAILRRDSDDRVVGSGARGDLAALLGLESDRPMPIRDVPVLYGNAGDGAGAMFDMPIAQDGASDSGFFELDLPPQLASRRAVTNPSRHVNASAPVSDFTVGAP
ncbi:Flp pilus assembly protein CpaB [Alcaligenaceae bacterium A4P071]|nr:Flp pilus assembly protein CpaB [Alcaligenaceae bacterium C4P045]MDQ2184433.1 Flp pilus assembly protein CpaB [Alcaligenaceae bacterium A4P071]